MSVRHTCIENALGICMDSALRCLAATHLLVWLGASGVQNAPSLRPYGSLFTAFARLCPMDKQYQKVNGGTQLKYDEAAVPNKIIVKRIIATSPFPKMINMIYDTYLNNIIYHPRRETLELLNAKITQR